MYQWLVSRPRGQGSGGAGFRRGAEMCAPAGYEVVAFGQGEPEHITVEARYPLGLAGDKYDSRDKPHISGRCDGPPGLRHLQCCPAHASYDRRAAAA